MPRWSVRAKLIAFAFIVLMPVLLVAYVTAQNTIAATRAQILSSSAATASVAVASVEDFLSTAERLLLILSATSAVQNNDRAAIADLFAQTLAPFPEYRSLYMLDADEHLLVNVPAEPPTANQMRYGSDALRNARASFSDRLGDAANLTAALAVPIKHEQEIRGALGVEFALQRLEQNIAAAVMREHAVVLLLDQQGRVLVAPESSFYSDRVEWKNVPIVQDALNGKSGAAEYRSPLDGSQWLGAYAPVRRAKWAVLVSYPSEDVFAPVRAATLGAALSLGGVLLLALALAAWLAARLTRPLRQVQSAARAIAQGDYDQRVPQAALPNDEVGQLAVAFNQMAEALQQHMRALMDAQHEIEQKASDLQQLLDRSVTVQEAERKRIAQEIHDGITQTLVGSIYEMQAAKQALTSANGDGAATAKLDDALKLVSETITEIRRVIFDLHPTILDELGLMPALQRLVKTSESESLRCALQVEGTPTRLSSSQELALYRIAQEALNNVRQHADAHHARVSLCFERDQTTLKVSDDGRGIAPTPAPSPAERGRDGVGLYGAKEHLGLVGMRERAQSVGGQLEIVSETEGGTSIVVSIPNPLREIREIKGD